MRPQVVYGSISRKSTANLTAVGTKQVTFHLSSIDRLPVSVFNFTGIGSSADSDPTHYLVATGNLPLTGFTAGNPAQGIGFVTSFGAGASGFQRRYAIQ